MLTIAAGLALAITAVLLWLGAVTVAQGLALGLGVAGLLLLAAGLVPGRYLYRRDAP